MSEEIVEGEISNEPLSTEIGSGEAEEAAVEESGLAVEADGAAVDELQTELEDAVADGATDAEIAEIVETFKIKVNGQEKDVTLDWNNKEDIVKRLQMAEAGQEAMRKSSDLEKMFRQNAQDTLDNPWEYLEQLGFDVDKLAEDKIQDRITQMQKSPEQLEREARDTELEDLRKRLKSEEDAREAIELEKFQQKADIDLDKQITDALSSTTELPKSPYVVKRIADAMLSAMENGQEDVTATDVVPWVEKQINQELQDLFESMPDKLLESYIGNKTIDRLRKSRIAKMGAPTSRNITETGKTPVVKQSNAPKFKLNDWLKHGSTLDGLGDEK